MDEIIFEILLFKNHVVINDLNQNKFLKFKNLIGALKYLSCFVCKRGKYKEINDPGVSDMTLNIYKTQNGFCYKNKNFDDSHKWNIKAELKDLLKVILINERDYEIEKLQSEFYGVNIAMEFLSAVNENGSKFKGNEIMFWTLRNAWYKMILITLRALFDKDQNSISLEPYFDFLNIKEIPGSKKLKKFTNKRIAHFDRNDIDKFPMPEVRNMIDSLKKQMDFLNPGGGLSQDFKESANKFINVLCTEASLLPRL